MVTCFLHSKESHCRCTAMRSTSWRGLLVRSRCKAYLLNSCAQTNLFDLKLLSKLEWLEKRVCLSPTQKPDVLSNLIIRKAVILSTAYTLPIKPC
eukprot:1145226-Pelagomonas_calceolata.AAC.1